MWRERNARGIEGEPDCQNCRVDLFEENEEAGAIYMMTRGQVVTVMNRVVDINFQSIKVAMDLCGVRNQRQCFEKVRRVFYHFLNEGGNEGS